MLRVLVALVWSALVLCPASASENGDVLFHFSLDEGAGATVRSGVTTGHVTATWASSPSGAALAFDGTPDRLVRVTLPSELRLGRRSWTFCAWLRPAEFGYPDAQNQRRVFSYGTFPDANIVVDILSSGHLTYYFCYRDPAGGIVSAGGSAGLPLKLNQWAHVAVVCNRTTRMVEVYIDGVRQSAAELPAAFDGDFSLSGETTLGSGWHNFHGLMDEVLLVRRALSRDEVKREFTRLAGTFGVRPNEEALVMERREMLGDELERAQRALAAGRWTEARGILETVVASTEALPGMRSYAHLRLAQSYAAEGRPERARLEYVRVARNPTYPAGHRREAEELAAELARASKRLTARDSSAGRTRVPAIVRFAAEVRVSPTGDDAHDGVRQPVATLARARDVVRHLRTRGVRGAVAVTLGAGVYRLTEACRLDERDSGTPSGPTVYRAAKAGTAVLYGGVRIRGFRPVTDRSVLARLPEEAHGRVVQCDLRAQGVRDYGTLAVRGFAQPPSPPTLEVFFNGKPLTLARWPNSGFVGIRRLIEPGNRAEGKPSVFEYVDDRHARWTQAEEPWLFGYFRYLWADATIRVTRIDPVTRTVVCGEAYQYGPPGMDTGQGIQYYAFNLLEEIDQPGEWYLDRSHGVLYLYPPSDPNAATVEIGMLSTPMLSAENVSDVRFEGLTFDLGRFDGLVLRNCRRCLIAGCTVRRLAGNGITVHGGEQVGILSCDIHTIGRRATEVIGGDRPTLKPGRHFVVNCDIHDFGRIDRTYTPAIQLEGVGNRAAHNRMYNCPSSVMRIEGNDHIIEYNDVFAAVRESDDQGAMELFGNPTYRGVVFRFNRFVDCGRRGGGAQVHGQAAIRLDDVISGMLLYGNVFVRSANGNFGAVQINSGRDNTIDNNLFVECERGISGGWYGSNPVWEQVARKENPEQFILSDLYYRRYPEMVDMLKEPGMNHVWRNVFARCGPMVTGNRAHLDLMANLELKDADLSPEAAQEMARRLTGFRAIPLAEIGLYRDPYRRQLRMPQRPGANAEGR